VSALDGRGAVVTGGAGGIGLALARGLLARDARLVLADIDAAALERTVDVLRGEGHHVHGVRCDVTSRDDVERLAEQADALLGQAELVFLNAGVGLGGPVAETTHDDWRWVIDVDLWGPIHGVEAFVPRLRRQGSGHLVFTASFAGLVPNVGLGAYCVAKYGVVALAEVLYRELRPEGVGVSVLCPMLVDTAIGESERVRDPRYGPRRDRSLDEQAGPGQLGGPVLDADDVAARTLEAVEADRLYVLPHAESREAIRRRFARIDRTFDEQGGAPPTGAHRD
jgi:NAD(P)-dependent dehydrogenase (short-subunit alcohol dehydrogenase family)